MALSNPLNKYHCLKYGNFFLFPGAEILWKCRVFVVSGESLEISTKFSLQEIWWNFGILRSVWPHKTQVKNKYRKLNLDGNVFDHDSSKIERK